MTSSENNGNSNPSITPIGSHQSPMMVDEDNTTTCSTPLDRPEDAQAQPNNEITEERGRLKSVAWNHFKKRKVDGKDKAECNYCTRLLVGGSKNGTRHLHDHLKICPRKKFKDIRDMKQNILVRDQHNVDSMAGVNAYHFDQDESRKELARMIILHEYPLSIVDHIGFRRYSTSLQPLFKMVCRNTIKKDIMGIYDHEREKSMHEIEKNCSRIAITTDMWTSQNKKRGFIYVPSPHTKEVLFDVLLQTLLEWNIDRKLSIMIVDNCSTNDAVINIILDKLQRSTLVMRGLMLHMRCAAHVLNFIIQNGLNVIGSCIEKVRESVGFWTGSTKRRQQFTDTARQLHIECTKELALDCKTCWNSTYLMLSTAIEYRDVFFRLSQWESSYKCIPKKEEWEMASSICERLTLFYKVTELFSEKFDCYWNVIHGVMVVANILDPRYKIELLEYYFPLIYGDEAENEIQNVRDTCYEMIRDYTSGRMGREVRKKRGGNIKLELEHYLEDDLMPRTLEFDILARWKSNGPKYPTLQRIARDIIAIPVSTVASESAFSTSGRLQSLQRSKLHAKTVEALMCAQNWLWAEIKGLSSIVEGIEANTFQNILDDSDDEEESCHYIGRKQISFLKN
nr:zinc finger BED domain-containing protein RICESLEEPER 3-like [Quercus suber]